jgi:hypothetical protein
VGGTEGKYKVRPLHAHDAPVVMEMWSAMVTELSGEAPSRRGAEGFAKILMGSARHGLTTVITGEDGPVGFVCGRMGNDEYRPELPVCSIEAAYVRPHARGGRGIYMAVAAIEAAAITAGACKLYTHVDGANSAKVEGLRRDGWAVRQVQMGKELPNGRSRI